MHQKKVGLSFQVGERMQIGESGMSGEGLAFSHTSPYVSLQLTGDLHPLPHPLIDW